MRRDKQEDTQLPAQFVVHDLDPCLHEQRRRVRIGDDFLDDAIASVAIRIR
jgi:hypothetical protein